VVNRLNGVRARFEGITVDHMNEKFFTVTGPLWRPLAPNAPEVEVVEPPLACIQGRSKGTVTGLPPPPLAPKADVLEPPLHAVCVCI